MAGMSKTTQDHDFIRQWAEERGAKPCRVRGTQGQQEDGGLLRLNFPGYGGPRLEEISWDEWFRKFDEKNLIFLYQDRRRDGELSNFFKLVRQETVEQRQAKRGGREDRRAA